MASDGIFDKMTDEDVSKSVWISCEAAKNQLNQGKEVLLPSGLTNSASGSINVH